jgi:hypothetical protein
VVAAVEAVILIQAVSEAAGQLAQAWAQQNAPAPPIFSGPEAFSLPDLITYGQMGMSDGVNGVTATIRYLEAGEAAAGGRWTTKEVNLGGIQRGGALPSLLLGPAVVSEDPINNGARDRLWIGGQTDPATGRPVRIAVNAIIRAAQVRYDIRPSGPVTAQASPWGQPGRVTTDGRVPRSADTLQAAGVVTSSPRPLAPVVPTPLFLPEVMPTEVPDGEPVTQPQPAEPVKKPQAPPIAPPITPTTPTPVPTTTPTKTDPQGRPIQLPLPLPRVTPQEDHFIGDQRIPAGGPRVDLRSIAQEVGRIENKTAKILRGGENGKPTIQDLRWIFDELQKLWNYLNDHADGDSYWIASPCSADEDGNLDWKEVPYEGGSKLDTVLNKLDALAELAQLDKELPQPVCDVPVPSGNVTVHFTEVV